MGRIIRKSYVEETTEFRLSFDRIGCEGSGFSFSCDESGNVLMGELGDSDLLEKCRAGIGTFVRAPVVRRYDRRFRHSAILACECGREVHLSGFTNACACGLDYNQSGAALAPRCQWGEETGEHPADIARIR